jgi:hypothetical protein
MPFALLTIGLRFVALAAESDVTAAQQAAVDFPHLLHIFAVFALAFQTLKSQ